MKRNKRLKTNTFAIILENYFRIHVFASLAIVLSFLFLFIASVYCFAVPQKLLGPDSPQLIALLIAVFFMAPITGYHLRRVVMSNAGALFPFYRQKQLNVMFAVMAVYSLWPVLVLAINGFPLLKAVVLFTAMPTLMLSGGFLFGESGLVMIGSIWLTKLLWDMMGIATNVVIIPSLFDLKIFGSSWVLPVSVILVSMALFFRFCRFFLRVPGFRLPIRHRDTTNAYSGGYDRTNWLTAKMTPWSMERLLKRVKNNKRSSIFSSARLIQPALFSPNSVFVSQTLLFSIFGIVTMGAWFFLYFKLAYHGRPLPISGDGIFLILFYHIFGGFTSLDFLQHRHRLPGLWVQLNLPSRGEFARATALSYFMVLARQALIFSLIALALPLFIKEMMFMQILAVIAAGYVWVMLLASVTLRWSNKSTSADSREFMIGIMVVGAWLLLIILALIRKPFGNTPATWYTILGAALFALFLIFQGYQKWRNAEIDFKGPEIFAPGIN